MKIDVEGNNAPYRSTYYIWLLNVEREEKLVKKQRSEGYYLKPTKFYPIEKEAFHSEKEAHEYAKQLGLKEDEYKIGRWL